jgi:ATP phosphoribosyltransferase
LYPKKTKYYKKENMERLSIAVQKSGRLQEGSLELLKKCGISVDSGNGQLKVSCADFPLEVLFLRNSDIPQYVQDGVADIAIIGGNLLEESDEDVQVIEALGFSKCRVSIAVPKNGEISSLSDLNGKKIATSYPVTLQKFLDKKGINAEIHTISGSVEIAPNIGLAEGICDIVSSGNTLFMNGLRELEVILKSEAVLIANKSLSAEKQRLVDQLLFRIRAVQAAKTNKYVLLNAPVAALDKITEILPGVKSPTILPLADKNWVSVHSVINENRFWEVIDQLREAGAQGILIVPIEKMVV